METINYFHKFDPSETYTVSEWLNKDGDVCGREHAYAVSNTLGGFCLVSEIEFIVEQIQQP